MKRIITPAIFLSASILAGCTTSSSGTTPGDEELAGETGDGAQTKADGIDTLGIYEARTA